MQPAEIVAFVYQVSDVFAFLVLAAAGLAIIFGMMGVINMAHGEFIAMGGYVTTYAYHAGVPLALAMLLGAVASGFFGVFLERTIVRRFYHRPIDSLVATWGISLIMTQGALLLLGSGAPGVGTPFGSVSFGGASFSVYRLVLVVVALALLVGLYLSGPMICAYLNRGEGWRRLAVVALLVGYGVKDTCQPYIDGLFTLPIAANNIYEQQYQMHRFEFVSFL